MDKILIFKIQGLKYVYIGKNRNSADGEIPNSRIPTGSRCVFSVHTPVINLVIQQSSHGPRGARQGRVVDYRGSKGGIGGQLHSVRRSAV